MLLLEVDKIFCAVLMANELIDTRVKWGRAGVVCELDIKKAHHHVKWNFLNYVLKE